MFKIKGALNEWTEKCRMMEVEIDDQRIHRALLADCQIVIAKDEQNMSDMIKK